MNNKDLFETTNTLKVFLWVLIAQVALSIAIGVFTDTLQLGLVASAIIVSLPCYFVFAKPNLVITKHVVAIATQLMASLHIQQTMGMTEMHFQVFVLLAFVSFFRDYKVIITATLVIAVHHIGGFASQYLGGGIVVFEAAKPEFLILVIHASFAILECAVLGFMAHKASAEHAIATQMNHSIGKIMAMPGTIDLQDSHIPTPKELHEFRNLLVSVKSLVQQTHAVGGGIVNVAEKVKVCTLDIDNTVGEQNNQVTTISEAMNNITHNIGEVARLSQTANTISDNAKTSTENTRVAIESSQSSVNQLKNILETTAQAISELSGKCENISSVMKSIKSVAEQTNLLALNAAIESARAGEHGRGFAVVADEVRNLAIKSKESAEEIELITDQLTQSANQSVGSMNECVTMVEHAAASSQTATQNMLGVLENIEQVNENVSLVTNSANAQADVSKSISLSTDQLFSLFEDERVQVAMLKQDVIELNQLADELNSQLMSFKF